VARRAMAAFLPRSVKAGVPVMPRSCSTCFVTDRFPGVRFGDGGRCDLCTDGSFAEEVRQGTWGSLADLQQLGDRIRQSRTGKYDCVIGVSGGMDSSYVAYVAKRLVGLNPLLVHYDHGFFCETARRNLAALVDSLGCDLRVLRSSGQWDRKHMRSLLRAMRWADVYWGLCFGCTYALPASLLKVALQEGITVGMFSANLYEARLRLPRGLRLRVMAKGVFGRGLPHLPLAALHLLAASYYLLRLKLELSVPPASNLWRRRPRMRLQVVNVTNYLPWDVDAIRKTLEEEIGWRLPQHPSLGMRFDCRLEDAFVDHTYREATGSTLHSLIADNLVYAGVRTKQQVAEAVDFYAADLPERMDEVLAELGLPPRPRRGESQDATVAAPAGHPPSRAATAGVLPVASLRSALARPLSWCPVAQAVARPVPVAKPRAAAC